MAWTLEDDQTQAQIKPQQGVKWVLENQEKPQEKPGAASRFGSLMTGIPQLETAAALASGMGASALGGLAGIGAGLSKAAGLTNVDPADVVKDIQQRLTYQPRTELGQQGVQAVGQISTLGGLIPAAAEKVGGLVQDVTGSPLAATAAHVATEALPQILGAKGATLAAPALRSAAGAVGATAERALNPIFEKFVTKQPEAMPGVGAAESGAMAQRQARMESLPFPPKPMEGQLTRDMAQQQFERETAKSPGQGAAIRNRYAEQNADLLKNFDAFQEETGATAPDLLAVGKSVDTATRNRMLTAKHEVDSKYQIARAQGAMEQPLPVDSLIQYANDNFSSSTNAPVIGVLGKELKRLGAAEIGPEGELIPTGRPLPISSLEDIRQTIGNNIGPGPNMNFGPQIKNVIDQLTEGQGGPLYQEARSAYAKYAGEFKNQGAIAKILATKPGTADRAIAYEDVWQKAVPGDYSVQDLRNLRTTLFRGGPDGAQAWRDLGGATVDWIKQSATKNVAMDELGNPIVSAAGMRKAMNTIGRDKMELLFGKRNATRMQDLADTIDDLKIAPPGAVNWSNTAATIMAALADVGISGLTGIPLPISSGIKYAIGKVKDAKLRARVESALNPPKE